MHHFVLKTEKIHGVRNSVTRYLYRYNQYLYIRIRQPSQTENGTERRSEWRRTTNHLCRGRCGRGYKGSDKPESFSPQRSPLVSVLPHPLQLRHINRGLDELHDALTHCNPNAREGTQENMDRTGERTTMLSYLQGCTYTCDTSTCRRTIIFDSLNFAGQELYRTNICHLNFDYLSFLLSSLTGRSLHPQRSSVVVTGVFPSSQ